uniref:hypothetical protein n=1 Tax=Paractinoplanes polyasparticus TaxID=2856853 RepID=UPI001C85FF89|nr:hypothetical protein [Actinoplanes polyasparticus]
MLMGMFFAAETPPLSERLLVSAAGPIAGAIVGTGVIGWLLWLLSNKAENGRKDLELQHARHELDNKLRQELLTPLLSAAAELYLSTQHYWRAKNGGSRQELKKVRLVLDAQYLKSRSIGTASEAKLRALFETEEPAEAWHKVDDLLTVRYMQLVGRATPRLYAANARDCEGKEHSGLSVRELQNPIRLLAEYHSALNILVPLILETPLRRTRPSSSDPAKSEQRRAEG